jgi:manganese/zinc/iron transport system substrate-binding protein
MQGPSAYPYKATATVGMIADIVRQVAGEKAVVRGLIGEGIDPHLYRPTRGDVATLDGSDIIFYNGLMLEGKMGDILVKLTRKGKSVFAVTEGVLDDPSYVLSDESDHFDPHVWMDVRGWIGAVKVVCDSLSSFDSKSVETYKSNALRYTSELNKLDAYAREVIASIPENQRYLITAHDAFSYLGRAYGLDVRGIQGFSTESEAGVRDLENLIDFIVEKNIPAVFIESSVADKNMRALIEGCRAKGHQLEIGGELFSDAMGPTGTYEGTYIGMIDHNVTTIARHLGGTAPELGMQGKLSYHRNTH